MAITATNLTSGGSATDTQSYNTASVTPGANKLILVAVTIRNYTAANLGTISLSGNGLTYVEIVSTTFSSIASSQNRISLFRAMGASPSTGAITITISGTGNSACGWAVDELDGIDTSGTNGSGAIVQSATDNTDNASSDPPAITLSALVDAVNNATYASHANANLRLLTPGGSYVELVDQNTGVAIHSMWLLPGTTTPTVTGFSSGDDAAGIGVEIKMAPAGGGGGNPWYYYAQL